MSCHLIHLTFYHDLSHITYLLCSSHLAATSLLLLPPLSPGLPWLQPRWPSCRSLNKNVPGTLPSQGFCTGCCPCVHLAQPITPIRTLSYVTFSVWLSLATPLKMPTHLPSPGFIFPQCLCHLTHWTSWVVIFSPLRTSAPGKGCECIPAPGTRPRQSGSTVHICQ